MFERGPKRLEGGSRERRSRREEVSRVKSVTEGVVENSVVESRVVLVDPSKSLCVRIKYVPDSFIKKSIHRCHLLGLYFLTKSTKI